MNRKGFLCTMSSHLHLLLVTALVASFAVSLWSVGAGHAAAPVAQAGDCPPDSICVNTPLDAKKGNDGLCSLREAIIAANSDKSSGGKPGECAKGNGSDTILLPPDTYLLTRTDNGNEDASQTGDLDITDNLNIIVDSPGATIDASGITDRILHILSGDVTITGVAFKNGGSNVDDGGGIRNSGTLTLTNVTVSGNRATNNGGGIYSTGTLILSKSTVSGNTAANDGGGLYNNAAGILTLNNSTVSGNASDNSGGGLFQNGGETNLNNVTITENTADKDGDGAGDGGGVRIDAGTVNVRNSIIGGNHDSSSTPAVQLNDCSGTLNSQGYNLIQDVIGCFFEGTLTGNITGQSPRLDPLDDYGGDTQTHRLQPNSPAIDAGDNSTCLPTDQRGVSRPGGLACDIGAFEVEDPVQTGPIFTVNSTDDPGDGVCTFSHCTLREAINAANEAPNGISLDEIHFDILGTEPPLIQPSSPLPVINSPVIIDGTTQLVGPIELNGAGAGDDAVGLTIAAGNSSVTGLVISGFTSHGILVTTDNNTIQDNIITSNGGDGVSVLSGIGNTISSNEIFDNAQLGIDLGDDGVTPLDPGDGDIGPNNLQNSPVVFRATPGGTNGITIEGRLNSTTSTSFTLEFFVSPTCDPTNFGEGAQFLGSIPLSTADDSHDVYFAQAFSPDPPVLEGYYVTATATDSSGNTSEFSPCVIVGPDNDIWPRAFRVTPGDDVSPAVVDGHYIDVPGRSRWYKFSIEPNSKVIVSLTHLAADYDLFLYKDIQATFDELTNPDQNDLLRLSAEFAPGSPSPGSPSPGSPSPGSPSPGSPSPGSPSLDAYAPGSPSPGSPSPGSPSPGSPSLYDFAPGSPSPGSPSPGSPSPGSPSFASAETRSFIAGSATDGLVDEIIVANTWNNTGDFYVRVMGDNGAFSLTQPFRLEISLLTGTCGDVSPVPPGTIAATGSDYRTIILHDVNRMGLDSDDRQALLDKLEDFAANSEVAGVVVDVSDFPWIVALNEQADEHFECPYAKNLVASAIKDIVDAYWQTNALEYVVIIGNDNVIPFFRHPDRTRLGRESAYAPPVLDDTASQASLQLDYVLSQDAYGAMSNISVGGTTLPLPNLAVGRLVETPTDIIAMLEAYEQTDNGVVSPESALVTGYDFLEDGAREVVDTLTTLNGMANVDDELIADQDLAPTDPESWTADQLRAKLLVNRYDLIYLAGHFSANSALAADYSTFMRTTELLQPDVVDMTKAIVFSPGCHSGYNIVNEHGIPGFTFEPDWAQALAQKGATLIAGTGYQYGDTEFVEYSERLYLNFARQLRTREAGQVVSVGQALVKAKQTYLSGTPFLRGMHEKALLEATLFGLPMLRVDMPGQPFPPPSDASIIGDTTPVPGNPWGLEVADISLSPSLDLRSIDLTSIDDGSLVTATWLQGEDGVVTNPYEPVLPRQVENVSVDGMVLRSIGFRGASYIDASPVIPLVGRPTTELAPVLPSFSSDIFFPTRPWNVNYFDALNAGGATRLILMPAQLISNELSQPGEPISTRRQLNEISFRLYYLGDQTNDKVDLVDVPTIVNVSAGVSADNEVTFNITVVGDPIVDVEDAWVTYTATQGPLHGMWQSLDLTRTDDLRLWQGTLPLGTATNPSDVRYIVQACNDAGLCSMATNRGAYFIPGVEIEPEPTALTLDETNPTAGIYGTSATLRATLTHNNAQPLADQAVTFVLGPERRQAQTDENGQATVTIPLLALPDRDRDGQPDPHVIRATFGGTTEYAASFDTETFTIHKQDTEIILTTEDGAVEGTLTGLIPLPDGTTFKRPLAEETVFFIVRDEDGDIHQQASIITDFDGRAFLGDVAPPHGTYTVFAYFSGPIPRPPETPIVTLVDERYNPSADAVQVVTVGNTPPQAVDDIYTFDGELTIAAPGVLENDSDVDGDPLTASLVSQPISGTVALSADGAFSYTPTLRFSGNDSFTYEASDGQGGADIGTVTLIPSICFGVVATLPDGAPSIWPPNGDFETVALSVADDATIIDISVFQDEPVGKKVDAIIDLANNSVQLRAERLGSGNGRVYHVRFTADDGLGNVCTGTLRVGVVPHDQSDRIDAIDEGPLYDSTISGNIPPQAVDDQYTTDENTLLSVAAADGVLSNDEDWDGDSLTVAAVNGDTGAVGLQVTLSSGALLTLNGDGSYIYDPDGQLEYLAVGEVFTDTFTYQASDSTDVSTATVSIAINGVNDIPTAQDDGDVGYTTDEDSAFTTANVLDNDTDPDNSDTLFIESIDTSGTMGLVTDNGDGTFIYDPNDQFEDLAVGSTATDTFIYTVADGNGGFDVATVTMTIFGLADTPPQAVEDQNTTDEDTVLSVNAANGVLGNDIDSDGDDTLTVTEVNGEASSVGIQITLPSGALLTLNADGSYDYDPNNQFEHLAVGETVVDTFTYMVSDGQDGTDTAMVTITIVGVNDAPLAADDVATTPEDTAVTIDVASNDSDVDSSLNPASASVVSGPSNGTATKNGDGIFTYTPHENFNGTDSFVYEICDTDGLCDTAAATVTVEAVNDPPVATNDVVTTDEDTPVTIAVRGNDNAGPANEDQTLTITEVSDPPNGTSTINAEGTVTYTPDPNYNGEDSFTYQVCDTDGACASATVTVIVTPVSDAPDAQDDLYTMNKGQTLVIDAPGVLGNDIAVASDELIVTAVNGDTGAVGNGITLSSGARLTLNADGSFIFTPRSNFRGEDLFTYTVSDGNAGSDTATVLITVVMPND
jgi:CSLREA domain-containing protein